MDKIIFEKEELRQIAIGVRTSILTMLNEKTDYSCSIDENTYWNYIAKYKSEIMKFLPVSYLCFKHKHKDTYIHCATLDTLNKIIKDGCLKKEKSSEMCSLGSAIYTYPLRSGMYFYKNHPNIGFLVFDAEETHYHIVQTDDVPNCIGEADFFCDELKIENPRILTYKQIDCMSKKFFDWDYAKKNYFGLLTEENATYESMYDILEYYNYNYKY